MNEKPILFSTTMVQAILEGRKTQTRRVVSKNNSCIGEGGDWSKLEFNHPLTFIDTGFPDIVTKENNYQYLHVPYDYKENETIYRVYSKFEPHMKLWVREKFRCYPNGIQYDGLIGTIFPKPFELIEKYIKHKDGSTEYEWTPSIFMPRWASRINLEVTEVRVQKLQDITHDDVIMEGLTPTESHLCNDKGEHIYTSTYDFRGLWDSINLKRGYGWQSNPFVWAISFKRIK